MRSQSLASIRLAMLLAAVCTAPLASQQRPLTFMDVQEMKRAGSWTPSPDGAWMLYTVTTPDWQEAESQTDIHVVSMREGASSSRQLTFTDSKDETRPAWGPDGSFFLFASDRDSDGDDDQLYMMRHDGGEARKITDADEGVSSFEFSPDGQWLVYRSGESGQEQLHRMATDDLTAGEAEQITDGEAGVAGWEWAPDGGRIYFVRPDAFDEDEKQRKKEGFTVDVKNAETPLSSLWSVDAETGTERRETDDEDRMSVYHRRFFPSRRMARTPMRRRTRCQPRQ